jgi:hypothetical protein
MEILIGVQAVRITQWAGLKRVLVAEEWIDARGWARNIGAIYYVPFFSLRRI